MPYPSGNYGTFTDVYTTSANLPNGLVLGQEVWDAMAGKKYKLFKANASITANKTFKRDPADSTGVIATAAVADAFEGVNSTGQTITASQCFWGQIEGDCTPLVVTTINAGVLLAASATSGTLQAAAAGNVDHIRCVTLVASGGGGATASRLYAG